jgi:hypothetical protein
LGIELDPTTGVDISSNQNKWAKSTASTWTYW